MNLNIYQCFYDDSQRSHLDSAFIPFDNRLNEYPDYREYVLWRKLLKKHLETEDYWGMVSWRWDEKSRLDGQEFKDWITNNPGHDVYFFDPSLEVAAEHKNSWIQGDRWHPGMINYCNKLFEKLELNIKVEDIEYDAKHFSASSFFIGNSKFWSSYIRFVDDCILESIFDKELNKYMFEDRMNYNGSNIPYFCFVIERLFSLFYYLNSDLKVLKFPIEHVCFQQKFGDRYLRFLELYKGKEHD